MQAFEHSINAIFCNIGKALGAGRVLDEAKQFGFYSKPPIELPSNEVAASGLYNLKTHSLYDNPAIVDPGRLAFGQEHLLVTPLQMALVAGAVANGGKVMEPHVLKEVTSPTGSVVVKVKPHLWRRAMKPATAAALNQMMQAVVQSGYRHGRRDPGNQGRRQDGNGRNGPESRLYGMVHLLRPRRQPPDRRCGRPGAPVERLRRLGCCSDRPAVDGGDAARSVEVDGHC